MLIRGTQTYLSIVLQRALPLFVRTDTWRYGLNVLMLSCINAVSRAASMDYIASWVCWGFPWADPWAPVQLDGMATCQRYFGDESTVLT